MSIKLTLWVVLGIISGFYFNVDPLLSLIGMVLLLPLLYWIGTKQPREGIPFFEGISIITSILLGVFVVGMALPNNLGQHYSNQDISDKHLWQLKVREVLKSNPYSQRYVTEVISLAHKESSGKILLSIPSDSTNKRLKVDDELFTYATPGTIKPPLNPYQFDYKDYLKKQGIYHQINSNFESILMKENTSRTILGIASNFREQIISKLKQKNFGPEELAVTQALLLGQRDDISEATYNNYKNAGAVHILAVSGLHVGILLLILQFLLSPLERLPKGKGLKLFFVVLLLWGYAFIAGLSPSIVRAVTMFSFLAYAMYLNRPTNSFNIIALSILFILLIKPLFLFQVGFQMSYAAVIAIVWIYPKLQRFWFPDNLVVRKIWQLLSVSVAAQLGVLPISLFYFHQFPALFFVSNLLIIPFLGLILGLGILVILLGVFELLPSFLVDTFNWIIKMMNSIVGWVALQESFIIKNIPFDSVQLILGYTIGIALVVFLSKPKWRVAVVLFGGIIAFQSWNIWNQVQLHKKEVVILAHRSRNSILLHQTGSSLSIITADSSNIGTLSDDYTVAELIQKMDTSKLNSTYTLGNKKLFIVDSLGLFPLEKHQDVVLLTQSPKIHLERLLDSIRPKMILADGSNYPSLVKQWKQTCVKKEIPFHYTGEKGYYVFSLKKD